MTMSFSGHLPENTGWPRERSSGGRGLARPLYRVGLVVSRPCVDPLKRRDECGDYCDYHRSGEKCEGGMVVTHEADSTLE